MPARLEALAATAGLDRQALHSQLASGLRLAVHLIRPPGGRRRVAEVAVLGRGGDGLVGAMPGWGWDGVSASGSPGPAAAGLAALLAGS